MNQVQEQQDNVMARLLAEYSTPARIERGTLVRATIINIDRTGAWVDFGGKTDGLIPADELEGSELKPGESTLLWVVSGSEDDEIALLSWKRAAGWSQMQKHQSEGTTVSVKVTRVAKNKTGGVAGVNVTLSGLRGFVPFTLLGLRGKAIDALVGNELPVKVAEVSAEEGKLIFDHATIRAAELAAEDTARGEYFSSLQPGQLLTGTVATVKEYGAFVDIGQGLRGLVHRSELTGDSRKPVTEQVKVGDTLTVKVLEAVMDGDKRKLSLSAKQVKQSAYLSQRSLGEELVGKVARKVAFGAFVELSSEAGVDGLLHLKQYPSAVKSGQKELAIGETVRVKVIDLDVNKGRIGLSMQGVKQDGLPIAS